MPHTQTQDEDELREQIYRLIKEANTKDEPYLSNLVDAWIMPLILQDRERAVLKAMIDELKRIRKTYKKKDGRANDLSRMTRAELDSRIAEIQSQLTANKEGNNGNIK